MLLASDGLTVLVCNMQAHIQPPPIFGFVIHVTGIQFAVQVVESSRDVIHLRAVLALEDDINVLQLAGNILAGMLTIVENLEMAFFSGIEKEGGEVLTRTDSSWKTKLRIAISANRIESGRK